MKTSTAAVKTAVKERCEDRETRRRSSISSSAESFTSDTFPSFGQSRGIHHRDTHRKSLQMKAQEEQDTQLLQLRTLLQSLITRLLTCNMICSQLRKSALKGKNFTQLRTQFCQHFTASLYARLAFFFFRDTR